MPDAFSNYTQGLESPATNAQSVTPNDGADVPVSDSRALYVGGSGNVSVVMTGGQTVTFNNVQSGSILPIRAARVRATGTTATNIVSLW